MKKKGFTLIELMIVVAIIGILAAVAIPSFLRFINKSKTNEASINMRAMLNGAIAYFNDEHTDSTGNPMKAHFPNNDSPTGATTFLNGFQTTPSSGPCGTASKGSLYVKNAAQWQAQPWLSLRFSVNKAHYYQYSYNTMTAGFGMGENISITAVADLDCDGTTSNFFQQATANTTSHEVMVAEPTIYNDLE